LATDDEEELEDGEGLHGFIDDGSARSVPVYLRHKGQRRGHAQRTEATGVDGAAVETIADLLARAARRAR